LDDLSSRDRDRLAGGVDVVHIKAEAGVTFGRAAAVVKRDGGAVLDELGPLWRLVAAGCEAERLLVKGRAADDVRSHEHEIRLRDFHRASPFNSGSDCRSVLSSETFPVLMSGRIRLMSPVSTVPGPNS